MEAKFIVSAFVDAINTRDIDALAKLMATDSLVQNQVLPPLPDYRIQVDRIISDCHSVVLLGSAISTHGTVPAVWIAQLCGQHIVDWQVYFDGQITCAN